MDGSSFKSDLPTLTPDVPIRLRRKRRRSTSPLAGLSTITVTLLLELLFFREVILHVFGHLVAILEFL